MFFGRQVGIDLEKRGKSCPSLSLEQGGARRKKTGSPPAAGPVSHAWPSLSRYSALRFSLIGIRRCDWLRASPGEADLILRACYGERRQPIQHRFEFLDCILLHDRTLLNAMKRTHCRFVVNSMFTHVRYLIRKLPNDGAFSDQWNRADLSTARFLLIQYLVFFCMRSRSGVWIAQKNMYEATHTITLIPLGTAHWSRPISKCKDSAEAVDSCHLVG